MLFQKGQVTTPHGFRTHNGRKFGKRFGRKGGKARWASMTQEEKDMVFAKRDYAIQQRKKLNTKLAVKTSLTIPTNTNNVSKQQYNEIEEFFGDII